LLLNGTLSIDGCDLYYEQVGTGTPVVLIHGAGAYAGLYAPCIEQLQTTHRVIAYDRRGCSRSLHPPVKRLEIHVTDAANLIRELIGQPAIVVGWSAGGTIALRLAIAHPDLVASLVLVEPSLHLKAPYSLPLAALVRWQLRRLTAGDTAGALVFYRWVSQYRGNGNAFDSYPREWQDEMLRNAAALFTELQIGGGALGEGLRRSDLAALNLPIQVLAGTRSAPIFAPAARYLVRVVPEAELLPVSGASHMVPTDRPDVVGQAVRRVAPDSRAVSGSATGD